MAYRSTSVGSVRIIRWSTFELADLVPLVLELRDQQSGEMAARFAVIVLPPGTGAPDADVASALARWVGRALDLVEEVHFVVEGSGFQVCVLHSILSTVVLKAGKRRRVSVHGALLDAVSAIGARAGVAPVEVLRGTRDRGLSTIFPGNAPARRRTSRPPRTGNSTR